MPIPKTLRAQLPITIVVLAGMGLALATAALAQTSATKDARALIEQVVATVGTPEKLRAMNDVEYVYLYRDTESGKIDLSIERYRFDGELSWARYAVHEVHVAPGKNPGVVVQGFNGHDQPTWSTFDGEPVTDPQALKTADFLRKTNFYWFTMMFKLLDPGASHTYQGTRHVDGTDYDIVKLTFGQNVGDVADTYLLYINPKTHLIDRFLFTVLDFGMTDPFLMKVRYEQVRGLTLPTQRSYSMADWDGNPKPGPSGEEISLNIRFNNGFDRALFAGPE